MWYSVFGFLVGAGALTVTIAFAWWIGLWRCLKVEEGTASAFQFLGRYAKTVMSLEGARFEAEFIERDGRGRVSTRWNLFVLRIGGLVFYNNWFIKPTDYCSKNAANDGFGAGFKIFLNQVQKEFQLQKAETMQGEDIPLDIRVAFQARVVNPYLLLFVAPKDVIAQIIKNMEAIVRGFVKANTNEDIQRIKSNGGRIRLENDAQGTIARIEREWGIEILVETIAIMDVGLMAEDQSSFALRKRNQLQAAAGAQELVGAMLENVAVSLGLPDGNAARAELQKTAEGTEYLKQLVSRANQVVAQRALGVKPSLFGNADGTPLEPVMGALASLLTLARGAGNQSDGGGRQSGRAPKGIKSEEEAAEEFKEKHGVYPRWAPQTRGE